MAFIKALPLSFFSVCLFVGLSFILSLPHFLAHVHRICIETQPLLCYVSAVGSIGQRRGTVKLSQWLFIESQLFKNMPMYDILELIVLIPFAVRENWKLACCCKLYTVHLMRTINLGKKTTKMRNILLHEDKFGYC